MNKVLIFALGATVGSLVTWKIVKDKYEKIADDEIESVIEYYRNKEKETSCEAKEEPQRQPSPEEEELKARAEENRKLIKELGYANCEDDRILPYVIAPEEFGDLDITKTWMYYADDTLVDENDDIVSDPESIIGDALSHFGEYEDDCVHVRNEELNCDYEILQSEKTFSEVYTDDMKEDS